jgi:hypothetical protein
MNVFEALSLRALRGVVSPTAESNQRYVMRWYSKTFHTPLHEVANLPIEDVWLAFYEERYSALEPQELKEEIALALETPEQKAEREAQEAQEAFSEAQFLKQTEEAAAKSKVTPAPLGIPNLLDQVPAKLAETKPTDMPEDITMEFVEDPNEIAKLLDGGMANKTK